jgi:hypothetical protein
LPEPKQPISNGIANFLLLRRLTTLERKLDQILLILMQQIGMDEKTRSEILISPELDVLLRSLLTDEIGEKKKA